MGKEFAFAAAARILSRMYCLPVVTGVRKPDDAGGIISANVPLSGLVRPALSSSVLLGGAAADFVISDAGIRVAVILCEDSDIMPSIANEYSSPGAAAAADKTAFEIAAIRALAVVDGGWDILPLIESDCPRLFGHAVRGVAAMDDDDAIRREIEDMMREMGIRIKPRLEGKMYL